MPSARRFLVAQQPYELVIRARSNLPFACLETVKTLLASALARTQRDQKVVISHFLWMGNHLHLLFLARDAEQCVQFYSELMKKVTDYMKCLVGLQRLELWEPGGAVLARILDIDVLLSRIAYIYANPARAHLVNSVAQYPGFSSWETFSSAPQTDSHSQLVPWIRQPSIPTVGARSLSPRRDREIASELKKVNRRTHELVLKPNALYAAFGVEDKKEIAALNQQVFDDLRAREESYVMERQKAGRAPLGVERLRREPIMKPHTPKREPTDRKVHFFASSKEVALQYLEEFREFCDQCREAYRKWRDGNSLAPWPAGAYRPPLRPMANALSG